MYEVWPLFCGDSVVKRCGKMWGWNYMRDNICSSKRCKCVEKKHNCISVSDWARLIMCRIIIHAEGISASNNYNIYNTCISCIGYNHVDIYDKADLIMVSCGVCPAAGGQWIAATRWQTDHDHNADTGPGVGYPQGALLPLRLVWDTPTRVEQYYHFHTLRR